MASTPSSASSNDGDNETDKKEQRRGRKKHRRRRKKAKDDETDDSEANERPKHRSKSRKRKKRRRRSESSDEERSYDGSSSSSASSLAQRSRSRRRRRKRKSKHRKKHRKHRRKDDDDDDDSTEEVVGKYGILHSSDMTKSHIARSFERWMMEIKHTDVHATRLPSYKLQKYRDEYCDDYNTATLPHRKYYNYDAWEVEQASQAKEEQAKAEDDTQDTAVQQALAGMTAEKIADMKHQASLRSQMQAAFQRGDTETYQRLKDRLSQKE